jgi:dsRNA-specific ribonuclease
VEPLPNEIPADVSVDRTLADQSCPLQPVSNDRLEYLGDGVLELITKWKLYRDYPNATAHFMTDKKIAIVKNEHIGKLVLDMGLPQWYLISKNAEDKGLRQNIRKLGCLFEAFVGALFTDMGLYAAQTFVESVFAQHVQWTHIMGTDDNYKNQMQVIIQKQFKVTPHYLELGPFYPSSSLAPTPAPAPATGTACNTATNASTNAPTLEPQPPNPYLLEPKVYRVGAYLCLGQPIHAVSANPMCAVDLNRYRSIAEIHQHNGPLFICLGKGQHTNKTKAEQMAANHALTTLHRLIVASV